MGCSRKTISQKEIPLNPPVICPLRVYAQKLLAEYLARLEETALKTLRGQITATGPYRYRLEGIVRAS